MKTICIIVLMLIGCNGQSVGSDKDISDTLTRPPEKVVGIDEKDLLDHRPLLDFDSSYFRNEESFKSYFVQSFSADLGSIDFKDVTEISMYRKSLVSDLGEVSIYSVTFSEELPVVAPKTAYLVYSHEKKQAALLFIDDIELIKLRDSDATNLIAGRFDVRGKGYAVVYKLHHNKQFDLIFNSQETGGCETGVPVYNASLDCISYDPFLMKFHNNDRNKDGLNDLIFTGTVNSYCKGLEYNIGRNDRKPLHSEKVEIIFNAYMINDSLSWQLANTTICSKLIHSF